MDYEKDPVIANELKQMEKQRSQTNGQHTKRPNNQVPGAPERSNNKRIRQLPAYDPFPLDTFPGILGNYIDHASKSIGCDPALVALPVISAVAGCIGNSRAIRLKKDWIEPAIIWTATVAESGGHKSPAYRLAVRPLIELQGHAIERHKEALKAHQQEVEAWSEQPKGERGEKPKTPKEPRRYCTGDTTIEAVAELLEDNPKGILVCRDELDGWLKSFTRYKGSSGGSDRPQWLELHQAGTLIKDRTSTNRKKIFVPRACASVTGTIQPAVLAQALDADALQAGLGARFLMAMPPRKQRKWSDNEISDDVSEEYSRLLLYLLDLAMKDNQEKTPHIVRMTDAAKQKWIEFYDEWGGVQGERIKLHVNCYE